MRQRANVQRTVLAVVLAMLLAVPATAEASGEFKALNTSLEIHETGTLAGVGLEAAEFTFNGPEQAAGPVSCSGSTFSGLIEKGTATKLPFGPAYSGCKYQLVLGVVFAFNGCEFVFHVGELVAEGKYEGTMDIACPAGKEIELHMTPEKPSGKCNAKYPAQSGLGPVYYETVEEGGVRRVVLTTEIEGLDSTTLGTTVGFCGVGNGAHTNGSLFSKTRLSAESLAKTALDFEVG